MHPGILNIDIPLSRKIELIKYRAHVKANEWTKLLDIEIDDLLQWLDKIEKQEEKRIAQSNRRKANLMNLSRNYSTVHIFNNYLGKTTWDATHKPWGMKIKEFQVTFSYQFLVVTKDKTALSKMIRRSVFKENRKFSKTIDDSQDVFDREGDISPTKTLNKNDDIIKLISMNTIQTNSVNIAIPATLDQVQDKSDFDEDDNLSIEKNTLLNSK